MDRIRSHDLRFTSDIADVLLASIDVLWELTGVAAAGKDAAPLKYKQLLQRVKTQFGTKPAGKKKTRKTEPLKTVAAASIPTEIPRAGNKRRPSAGAGAHAASGCSEARPAARSDGRNRHCARADNPAPRRQKAYRDCRVGGSARHRGRVAGRTARTGDEGSHGACRSAGVFANISGRCAIWPKNSGKRSTFRSRETRLRWTPP